MPPFEQDKPSGGQPEFGAGTWCRLLAVLCIGFASLGLASLAYRMSRGPTARAVKSGASQPFSLTAWRDIGRVDPLAEPAFRAAKVTLPVSTLPQASASIEAAPQPDEARVQADAPGAQRSVADFARADDALPVARDTNSALLLPSEPPLPPILAVTWPELPQLPELAALSDVAADAIAPAPVDAAAAQTAGEPAPAKPHQGADQSGAGSDPVNDAAVPQEVALAATPPEPAKWPELLPLTLPSAEAEPVSHPARDLSGWPNRQPPLARPAPVTTKARQQPTPPKPPREAAKQDPPPPQKQADRQPAPQPPRQTTPAPKTNFTGADLVGPRPSTFETMGKDAP